VVGQAPRYGVSAQGENVPPSYLAGPALLREIWGFFFVGNGVSRCGERIKKKCDWRVLAIRSRRFLCEIIATENTEDTESGFKGERIWGGVSC